MKTILTGFLITWHVFAFAQKPCEDLVYNTRELTAFAYNTRCKTEAYPFLSEDGLHLYYTNNQTKDWLFYSHRTHLGAVWSVPVPVKIDYFSNSIRSCYVDPESGQMYFNAEDGKTYLAEPYEQSKTIFHAPVELKFRDRSGAALNDNKPFSCISMSPGGREMVAYLGGGNKSMGRFVRTGENEFSLYEELSVTKDEIGSLSRDGLIYYFVNTDDNVLYCRKRTALEQSFDNTVYMVKKFEPQLQITQPRVVMGGKSVVLVLSQGLWEKNEIYFFDSERELNGEKELNSVDFASALSSPDADVPMMVPQKDAPEPVKKVEIAGENKDGIVSISIGEPFPNPARGKFYIYYHISGKAEAKSDAMLVLTDLSGRVVHSMRLEYMQGEVKVEPEKMSPGLYLFRIEYAGVISASGKVQLTF